MKQWTKGLLATTLALGMALPVAAYAAEGQAAQAPAAQHIKEIVQQKWEHHQKEHRKHRLLHALSLGTHRQMYLTLLAEKYTPDSVDEWEAAFAERERLVTEWKAQKSAENDPKKQQLREEFKQLAKQLHDRVEKGEITREQMKLQLKEWRTKHLGEERSAGDKEAFREFLEQFKQLHDEFDAAIESGDEAKIKAVMPKLLAEVETVNQHIEKKLEQKKN